MATIPPATPALISEDLGYPTTPPDLAQGAAIFAEHCTACHGVRGSGRWRIGEEWASPRHDQFHGCQPSSLEIPH
ncbi:MAG UNVERIFIED_CONTAM: c-type cytochrome [Anaerolineae bacterium]